jgi:neural Wiskott-Aldrich syndrome protein
MRTGNSNLAADSEDDTVSEPTPNDHRLMPRGETPLQAAPPVPGAPPPPGHPEQRLGPAPALPVPGGPTTVGPSTAGGNAGERPLAPAPLLARPAFGGRQLPAAPAVPGAALLRPGPQETPLSGVAGGPIGSRPEVPLARLVETPRSVGMPAPAVRSMTSATGVSPLASNPQALFGGAGPAGLPTAGIVQQPIATSPAGQSAPPDNPAWFQPPPNPPPVPPPSAGGRNSEPAPPRPVAWTPPAHPGPVGSRGATAPRGGVLPVVPKTSTAKSLRRESRARSSVLAVTFLLVAATVLIGMVVILLLSLSN